MGVKLLGAGGGITPPAGDLAGTAAAPTVSLPAWTVYAPAWTAVTTPPAIGNGVLTGRYLQRGKLIIFVIVVDFGSTTTFGVGKWRFSLPVASFQTDNSGDQVCTVWGYHAATGFHYTGIGVLNRISNAVLTIGGVEGLAEWDSAIPVAWANGDRIGISGSYEAA